MRGCALHYDPRANENFMRAQENDMMKMNETKFCFMKAAEKEMKL